MNEMDNAPLSPLGLILGWCLIDGYGTGSARVMARALVQHGDGTPIDRSDWPVLDQERRAWLCSALKHIDHPGHGLDPAILDILRRFYGPTTR